MVRPRLLPLLLLAALPLLASPAEGRSTRERALVLGRGTAWETTAYLHDGPRRGPTVMIVGGMHGDERAGAQAAEQIRHWPIARGRLLVLPRANVRALAAGSRYTPGVPRALRNLNRNFPDATETPEGRARHRAEARGDVAPLIWDLVRRYEPDWLLDLHEGFAVHRVNPKSCGRSLIVPPAAAETHEAADRLIEAADETLPEDAPGFIRLRQTTRTTLARSAADHFGTRTLILETCLAKTPLSRRVRRHRVMVLALLEHLDMRPPGLAVTTVLPARRAPREVRVALYDAEGTGGAGVPRATAQIGARKHAALVRVGPEDIRDGILASFDVVVFTGGSGSGESRALGEEGRARVRAFVEAGGGYIGICAGAYLALAGFSWSVPLLDGKTVSPLWKRGRGRVQAEWTAAGRRVFATHATPFAIVYGNGPVFAPLGRTSIPDYEVWARYTTELADNGTPEGIMVGSPAIAAAPFGDGRVVVIGPHPEQTQGLEDILPRCVEWAAGRR